VEPNSLVLVRLFLHRFNHNRWSNSQPHSNEESEFYSVALPDTRKFYPLIENPDGKTITKRSYQLILRSSASIPKIAEKRTIGIVQQIWNKIKKFPLSPESRNLWWLVSHDAINTKYTLFKRSIVGSAFCPRGDPQVETTTHCLITCDFLREAFEFVKAVVPPVSIYPPQALLDLAFLNPLDSSHHHYAIIFG
jgi:zinc-binding in reverse transcriptase